MATNVESSIITPMKNEIKAIWGINFQGHRKSKIILSNGITGLIGDNDSGKTALSIRVLNLIRFNRPKGAGTKYINDHADSAKAGVEFADGSKVILQMFRKKSNAYVIIEPDGTKHIKKVIGTAVPDEVIQKFGNFGEINLQTQRETAYFILDTAGTVARLINMTQGIGNIDKVLSKLKSRISLVDNKIDNAKEDLKETQDILKQNKFTQIDSFRYQLKRKLRYLDKMRKIRKKNEYIVSIIRQLSDLDDQIGLIEDKVISEKELIQLEADFKALSTLSNQIEKLEKLVSDYEAAAFAEQKISILTKQEYNFLKNMENMIAETEKLESLIDEYEQKIESEQIIKSELSSDTKELDKIFKVLDVCPLCNTALRKKNRKD